MVKRLTIALILSLSLLSITLTALADGPPVVIVSHNLSLAAPGCLFLAPFTMGQPGGELMIVNNWGAVVWSQPISGSRNATDFKLQPNGLVTYFDRNRAEYVAMDQTLTEVATYTAIGYAEGIDQHDLILPDDERVLYIIYDTRTLDLSAFGGITDARVVGGTIQETTAGAVTFEWSVWDHLLITDTLLPLTGTGTIDPWHINSVGYTPDGDVIISSRNSSEVTRIDYDTGAVEWRLGGKNNQFALISDTVWFGWQHDARLLDNGNLTLFDNGGPAADSGGISRAIEYEIDTQAMTITPVWSYSDGTYAWFMGDVQRLPNGNTLVGWGGANADNGGPYDPAVTEVTPDGEVVLQMTIAQTNTVSYRALRFDWPGCGARYWLPVIGR